MTSNQETSTQDWSDFSLISLFRLEAETQMAVINKHLLLLETEGAVTQESIDTLMRAAHSIKGAARIVQIEAVVKVAHVLEDFFSTVRQGTVQLEASHIDVLLQASDLITSLSELEEAELVENATAYTAKAQPVVLAIQGLLKDEQQPNEASADVTSDFSVQTSVDDQGAPKDVLEDILETLSDDSIADDPVVNNSIAAKNHVEESSPVAAAAIATETAIKPVSAKAESAKANTERMIRMSASTLNRLMGLAGESLVESNWLQPFAASLSQLKQQQRSVLSLLETVVPDIASENNQETALNKAIASAQACQTLLSEQLSDLELFSTRFGQLSDRLYREVIASHMCAFETGTRGYGRLVRDTAKSLGKQVKLELEGLTTQVDRDILERLDAPITHLLTNAIAHGIESPEQRSAAGKAPMGTIRISARHRSGMLIITVEDDGSGINFDALRDKVMRQSMTTPEVAAALSRAELIEFLFLPGFSTVTQVSELAGRGYGLDIARNMVQSCGGALQAYSTPAEGTRFEFQLPLTLSVVRSLLLKIANEPYAISLAHISRVLKLSPQQIQYSENRPFFSLEGDSEDAIAENISLVSARQLLGLPAATHTTDKATGISVIVLGEPGNRYGLWVDRFLEEKDLVVRPLDTRLGKVPSVSSAALTEKGNPILILDVADLLDSATTWAASNSGNAIAIDTAMGLTESKIPDIDESTSSSAAVTAPQKRILVVDDSMTVRAMEKKLLQNKGYAVDVAINGVEGWRALRMHTYDLVVTDVDMPRMNGIELIEKIRAHRTTQKLPVIVVSYKDRTEDQLAGLKAGANYYLTKSSFHDDGLITAVVDLIGTSPHTKS